MTPVPSHLTTALFDSYRIERELGAGGMATVYLAYDVRHDRRVALKVLKPELSAVVGADRFLAEIRTTANLQHPHILPLHDSGSVDGAVFYVMPFVDGESLRDRLNREKQLPVDEALRIATEVADALQYAHEHGVIHRDIKPENILLQGGHALVADFGIALAASNTAGGRITETGMSLGTPTYMSPEQAMGERTLDARTDVYALGCVLYEMLVGEPPFTGATAQQIVARVMTEDPRSLTMQRKTVPQSVDAAVASALSKLPADRPSSAAAFTAMLRSESRTPGATFGNRRKSNAATMIIGVAFAAMLTVAAWGWMRPVAASAPVSRDFIRFAPGEEPLLSVFAFTLLRDGSAMVYVGKSPTGTQLWVKKRSELHASPLSGTEGARSSFPSPDGKWLGFYANSKLKKIPVAGGDAVTLADAGCFGVACDELFQGSGGWLEDGRILFRTRDALAIVSENGGAPDSVVTSRMVGGLSPLYPSVIPHRNAVLFTTCTLSCNKSTAWALDLDTRKVKRLFEPASYVVYLPTGHILYADASGAVHARAFDVKSLSPIGPELKVLEHVAGNVATANDGTIVYLDGDPSPRSFLSIVGKDGSEKAVDTSWVGDFSTLALSLDGKRIVASMVNAAGEEHLWVKTLGGSSPARLTFAKGQYTTPSFTPDGQSVMMTYFSGDSAQFISRRIDGTAPTQVLMRGKNWVIESVTSRDGQWRVTRNYNAGERAIYARRLTGSDSTDRVIVKNASSSFSPALSPDSKWLLYANEETGRVEVWAVPFPEANGSRWQVSNEGGSEPSWSPDGKTIYYVNSERKLASVDVNTSAGFALGARHTLFDLRPFKGHPTHRAYEVMPDGQHFLMIHEGVRGSGDLVMVDNWFTELKRVMTTQR